MNQPPPPAMHLLCTNSLAMTRWAVLIGCFSFLTTPSIAYAAEVETKVHEATPLSDVNQDGYHDTDGSAIAILQNPKEAMKDFPKDRRGEVDWVKTLHQGKIAPRKTRTGDPKDGAPMKTLDMDIIMTRTKQMPYVRFPHKIHTEWLGCDNCHPDIFIMKKDANPITMTKILKGQFCGRCHDKVSFSLWTCERCHSVPHPGSPAAWWE